MTDQQEGRSAFQFDGNWRAFAPIAFTNLLLTIVTLGIYSFWGRTRVRQYLWSHTRFIEDRLEWTGTGLELLIGYVMVLVLFFLPLGGLNLLIQGLAMRGYGGLAALLLLVLYVAAIYLVGLGIFRALRYRLSRTFWRGIRGGSNEQGFRYGVSHLWKTFAGSLAFGLLIPWSMVRLWNERWNAMSFGPHAFQSFAESSVLMKRYLLFYLAPILLIVLGIAMALLTVRSSTATPSEAMAGFVIVAGLLYFVFFVLLGLVAMFYYAAYFREVVGKLTLGQLEFAFTARTVDWLKLMIGNFFLVVLTLGIGSIFLSYRNWSFFIRHLRAYGSLDLDEFTQSATREPGQGEGLLDAFDVGAF